MPLFDSPGRPVGRRGKAHPTTIHYRVFGDDNPSCGRSSPAPERAALVLIAGMGATHAMWAPQILALTGIDVLAEENGGVSPSPPLPGAPRLLVLDNRGCGASGAPARRAAYNTRVMAGDVLAVLVRGGEGEGGADARPRATRARGVRAPPPRPTASRAGAFDGLSWGGEEAGRAAQPPPAQLPLAATSGAARAPAATGAFPRLAVARPGIRAVSFSSTLHPPLVRPPPPATLGRTTSAGRPSTSSATRWAAWSRPSSRPPRRSAWRGGNRGEGGRGGRRGGGGRRVGRAAPTRVPPLAPCSLTIISATSGGIGVVPSNPKALFYVLQVGKGGREGGRRGAVQ
jgi:hypothetical protein